MESKLLTVQQVAEYLNVTWDTVYREVHRGRLKSVRVGRAIRITSEELERYVKRSTA